MFSFQIFLAVVFVIFIFKNDSFIEVMCPEMFWKKKIHKIENNIRLNQFKVAELTLFKQKEEEVLKYDLDISMEKARSFNKNEEQLTSEVKKDHEEKMANISRELEHFQANLNESKQFLDIAQKKYKEVQAKI